jgi:hypothetical protein
VKKMRLSGIIVYCTAAIITTKLKGLSAWSKNPILLSRKAFYDSFTALMDSRAKQKKVSRGQWAEARGFVDTSGADTAAATISSSSSTQDDVDDFCTVSFTLPTISLRILWKGINHSLLSEMMVALVLILFFMYSKVIGKGRIGSMLTQGEKESSSLVLGRGDAIPADGTGPIILCTRNDALEGIIDSCPENRRKDLVFVQNGFLDDFLRGKGLLDNTQALLYVSVTAKGAEPIDGVTSANPEGLTAVTGLHSQAFAKRLNDLGLKCRVLTPEEYRPAMFEKLM